MIGKIKGPLRGCNYEVYIGGALVKLVTPYV